MSFSTSFGLSIFVQVLNGWAITFGLVKNQFEWIVVLLVVTMQHTTFDCLLHAVVLPVCLYTYFCLTSFRWFTVDRCNRFRFGMTVECERLNGEDHTFSMCSSESIRIAGFDCFHLCFFSFRCCVCTRVIFFTSVHRWARWIHICRIEKEKTRFSEGWILISIHLCMWICVFLNLIPGHWTVQERKLFLLIILTMKFQNLKRIHLK